VIAPEVGNLTQSRAEVVTIENDDFLLRCATRTVGLCSIPVRFEAGLIQGLLDLDARPDVSNRD
jgi:hypothetical protein